MQLPDWPRAHGGPYCSAVFKHIPEDFIVEEELGFEPTGSGEHWLLHIEKRQLNTRDVMQQLSKFAGIHPKNISCSGLKDKQAIARQWFSVQMPGKAQPEWTLMNNDELQVLSASRHTRKLHRGTHRSNRFTIVLRNVEGDRESIEKCLQDIRSQGVPNYFGEQRFGFDAGNLDGFLAMQQGERFPPSVRSHYLSAARSFLFNEILAQRIANQSWNTAISGDVFMLNGSQSVFSEAVNELIHERIRQQDLHPTGLLYGRSGKLFPADEAAATEASVIQQWLQFAEGLDKAGMNAERRSLRLLLTELNWLWSEQNVLKLSFSLPSGCFATAVVRELATLLPVM
jgi:tRNA pseudouridine13 synthase